MKMFKSVGRVAWQSNLSKSITAQVVNGSNLMQSLLYKIALSAVAVVLVTLVGVHLSVKPAHAQFGSGGCVPFCVDDLPGGSTPGGSDLYTQDTDVYVRNNTDETVWVAMSYFVKGDPDSYCLSSSSADCPWYDRWITDGWWTIAPGGKIRLISHYLNQYVYFYAEGSEGMVWSGEYGDYVGDDWYGFFEVNVGKNKASYTLNLNP